MLQKCLDFKPVRDHATKQELIKNQSLTKCVAASRSLFSEFAGGASTFPLVALNLGISDINGRDAIELSLLPFPNPPGGIFLQPTQRQLLLHLTPAL